MRMEFNQAIVNLPKHLYDILFSINNEIKNKATEIRIRNGQPLSIISNNTTYFVSYSSTCYEMYNKNCYIITKQDIEQAFLMICEYSIHSFENEINNGFITIKGGHRVGFCGKAVIEDKKICGLKEINSINIRIARQILGVIKNELTNIFQGNGSNILIIGRPATGKTTVLKDIVHKLASGLYGRYHKVCVIDERGEIGASFDGVSQNNLGFSSDVFTGYSKPQGINCAIRTMSPDYIVCDEIGSDEDIEAIENCSNCGVNVIATLHCNSIYHLKYKKAYKLVENHCFDYIVSLEGNGSLSKINKIIKVSDVLNEDNRDFFYNNNL